MDQVEERDRVVELVDIPQQDVGAPMPVLLASGGCLVIAYLLVTGDNDEREFAVVEFDLVYAHYFGSPNDEALSGHPLYARGLRHYAAYEVFDSSWIRSLERMNRVHPRHDPRRYDDRHHYVFTFHDNTFECVARGIRKVACFPYGEQSMLEEITKVFRRSS